MNILKPKVELLYQGDNEALHIARCARVCYASNKLTNNEKLCDDLRKKSHNSMFRHAGVYYIIPRHIELYNIPYGKDIYYHIVHTYSKTYIATNRQFADEHLKTYKVFEVSWDVARNDEVFYSNKLLYYTFAIETGIDITRELNRKSPNAIAERSTRYVDFIKKIGIVFKQCHWMPGLNLYKKTLVKLMCKVDEWFYKISRSKYGLNLKPEDARWCLFLDVMSKAVYTYTVRDWEYIINLRLWDYTGSAHPDARIVTQQVKDILNGEGYELVNYKTRQVQ